MKKKLKLIVLSAIAVVATFSNSVALTNDDLLGYGISTTILAAMLGGGTTAFKYFNAAYRGSDKHGNNRWATCTDLLEHPEEFAYDNDAFFQAYLQCERNHKGIASLDKGLAPKNFDMSSITMDKIRFVRRLLAHPEVVDRIYVATVQNIVKYLHFVTVDDEARNMKKIVGDLMDARTQAGSEIAQLDDIPLTVADRNTRKAQIILDFKEKTKQAELRVHEQHQDITYAHCSARGPYDEESPISLELCGMVREFRRLLKERAPHELVPPRDAY